MTKEILYEKVVDACYYGQMKDHRVEEMLFGDINWTNYEYGELLSYLGFNDWTCRML